MKVFLLYPKRIAGTLAVRELTWAFSETSAEELQRQISAIVNSPPDPEALIAGFDRKTLERNKYDRYVPDDLLREAFVLDYLNIPAAITALTKMCTE